ncbi:MAG: DUF4365 domain-containing protein [Pseudomonadota bacterium]
MGRYSKTERLGINAVEQIVLNDLESIFREQLVNDMGIDAQIELVNGDKNPTGKLIAVQIKSGASHFRGKADNFLYHGKNVHLDYWLNHSLPVILVVHLPESGKTLWTPVNEETVERTKKGWKVSISKKQELDKSSRQSLESVVENFLAQQLLKKGSFVEFTVILS